MRKPKILIVAGGTGGHVFPGLAIARALKDQNCSVIWLGTKNGIESRVIPEAGFKIEYINVGGLRGKTFKTFIYSLAKLLTSFMYSFVILIRHRPDVVLGMGGFASGPPALAAFLLRYPVIIHEQNAIAGGTNKILARIASLVLEAFPGSFPVNIKAQTIGNPVRQDITKLEPPNIRLKDREGPIRILVLGGSQGSLILNKTLPNALKDVSSSMKLEVLHQAGEKTLTEAQNAYEGVSVGLYLVEFIEDMADAYNWADIVICRSGAMTVTELMTVGLPAILIPFSKAIDDHQTKNANVMKKIGAAEIIQEKDLGNGKLTLLMRDWVEDRSTLRQRALLATSMAKPEATNDIVKACLNYVSSYD